MRDVWNLVKSYLLTNINNSEKNVRRNRFSLSLIILIICLGIVAGLLGEMIPTKIQESLKDKSVFGLPYEWFWIVSIVVVCALSIAVMFIKERFDSTDEPARTNVHETKVEKLRRKVLTKLYGRYSGRWNHKLEGRHEISLKISDDSAGTRTRQFEEAAHYLIKRFEQQGRLVLAGEPGSGKTLLLLRLAKHLVKKAQEDASQPLPVIFNLASWSPDYAHFNGWVTAMLTKGYGLSSGFAGRLLRERSIIFLLDGLDELARNEPARRAADVRAQCLTSLDEALTDGSISVVICCRSEQLTAMIRQTGEKPLMPILTIHDLTEVQIDYALNRASCTKKDRFTAPHLLTELREDRNGVYQKVLSKPFYFSTALQVFDSNKPPQLDAPDSQTLEKNLVVAFVQKKLLDTPNKRYSPYPTDKTLDWLTRLAGFLNNRVTFELSDLQPSILKRKWLYRVLFSLFFGVSGGLVLALYKREPLFGVFFGVLYSLISVAMITEDFGRWTLEPLRRWRTWIPPFLFGALASISPAFLILIARIKQWDVVSAFLVSDELVLKVILLMILMGLMAFVVGVGVRLLTRVVGGITGGMPLINIQTEDFGQWTLTSLLHRPAWRNVLRSGLEGGVAGLFVVIMICLIGMLISLIYIAYVVVKGGMVAPELAEVFVGLFMTLLIIILGFIGFPIGFFIGILLGILRVCRETARFVDIHSPYQRLRAGIIFNILQLVVVGWCLILLVRVSNLPQYWRGSIEFHVSWLLPPLTLVIIFGLIGLFRTPLLKHLTLRVCLTLEGVMPLRYAAFLDYATDLGVLERDGGQWRFRHQILRDHFAHRDQDGTGFPLQT